MDARDRHHSDKAASVAREFGLEALDVDQAKEILPAAWHAWTQMPETRRVIGFLCEGLVSCHEAAEVASTKRTHMRGTTKATRNDLARQEVIGKNQAEIYRKLLQGIAYLANKGG
jgi:hypothetical protein